ncbi:MAG: hypothetical protein ABR907_01955 [Terracidiphilus sp.]|jgi:hypothetical protein
MTTSARTLREATTEVRRAAHDQDLVEVPRQAMLAREAEHARANLTMVLPEPVAVPDEK